MGKNEWELTHYQRNKERLRKQARDKYRNLSEEEKYKKTEYKKNRYHNMSKEKKQKLKEYQKIIVKQKNFNTKNKCSCTFNSFFS